VLVQRFRELGFSDDDQARWNQMTIGSPHGIVLVTGPDRLRQDDDALLDAQAARDARVNVCTIEDPIEMVEPAFNQMQVQHGIGLDFAPASARCCARTRTSSWSARSATWRRPRWRSRRR
jgi:general secretion pathway protein E